MLAEYLVGIFCMAFSKKSYAKAGLLFAVMADYFLLFTKYYIAGVLLFCGTQFFFRLHACTQFEYINKEHLQKQNKKVSSIYIAGIMAGAVVALVVLVLNEIFNFNIHTLIQAYTPLQNRLLFLVGSIYATMSVSNIITVSKNIVVTSKCRKISAGVAVIMFGLGVILLAACDINVLLYNVANNGKSFLLIWIFYIACQITICISTWL
ncbi:MAG: hypothetical protein ACI4DS_05925 [Eubacterium sp.]